MSNRTAESNKAIAVAWEKEKQRVSEGKGTRDWTPDQQQDILSRGKAYDDKGRAFRGHHMRSVSICPEEQGNPDNIQFLTHDEHAEAHVVCWQPTNWYYDPITKERTEFGDGPIVPCPVIELSEPVGKISNERELQPKNEEQSVQPEEKKSTGTDPPKAGGAPKNETASRQMVLGHTVEKSRGVGAFIKKARKEIAKGVKEAGSFVVDHRKEIGAVMMLAAIKGVEGLLSNSFGGGGSKSNGTRNYPSYSDSFDSDNSFEPTDSIEVDDAPTEDRDYPETHASPREHIVPGHGQHYNTKDGRIWKEKDPYHRGGRHSDDE